MSQSFGKRNETTALASRLGLAGAVFLGMLAAGCTSAPELDTSPDKVEERRQEFIQHKQREMDDGASSEEVFPSGS